MSETFPKHRERFNQSIENNSNHLESIKSSLEKNGDERVRRLESIRHDIEKQAFSKESLDQTSKINNNNPSHYQHITRQIKTQTYKNTMANVQKHLPKWQAGFSKLIHQQNIESISEVGAKTVARPSGIFTGSLIALIGSIIIIIVAKRIGFSITPMIFISLFVAGFALGLIIEFIIKAVKKIAGKSQKTYY